MRANLWMVNALPKCQLHECVTAIAGHIYEYGHMPIQLITYTVYSHCIANSIAAEYGYQGADGAVLFAG